MISNPDLVRRASALRPVLERHRQAGDEQRNLPGETVDALTGAGLLRAVVPSRFGGGECDLPTVLAANREVAGADPSAGWVMMIFSAANWLTGLFEPAAQEEIYADGPDTHVCSVLTPHGTGRRAGGGWILNGNWAPASGCLHATWALLAFSRDADGPGFALVPMSELTVSTTWFTLGMRATGSHLLIGADVFVPDHRVLDLGPAVAGVRATDVPRYRSALIPTLTTCMIAPYLGIASAVLEHVVDHAEDKGIPGTRYQRRSDSAAFQIAVARAATNIDLVEMIGDRAAATVDGHAAAGTHPDYATRARIRQHAGHAVQLCLTTVDELITASGSSALADSHPLQGYVRDIHTAARHAMANPAICAEAFGRALLGTSTNITDLI